MLIPIGALLAGTSGGSVHLRPEHRGRHSRYASAHDVDRLVRVFRDVVRARAVELEEHVVYWVLQCVLDVCSDCEYGGREGAQRW
jgi:hypothetical protein